MYNILSVNNYYVKPNQIVVAIAVQGQVGDWAAYMGIAVRPLGIHKNMAELQYIAETGVKLIEREALGMFPQYSDKLYRK